MQTKKFFDKLKDHSEIKLRILRKFAVPWSAKLGRKVTLRKNDKLWYIDGFAGRAYYGDGAEGSPLIGAKQALGILKQNRGYQLGCINIELDTGNYDNLCKATRPYGEDGVLIYNIQGDFSENIPKILEIIGSDDPILLFIDPFGLSPLKFDKLSPLIKRSGEVDVVITLNTRAVARLVADHPDIIASAIGSSEWNHGGTDALETFGSNLQQEGRFLTVVNYPIREEVRSSPRYHLVMASRHPDAFELLNDMVLQEETQLSRKAYANLIQSSFLLQMDEEENRRKLLSLILDFVRGHSQVNRSEIIQKLVLDYWGNWHTSEMKQAVWGLIDSGNLLRNSSAKSNIDSDILTLGNHS